MNRRNFAGRRILWTYVVLAAGFCAAAPNPLERDLGRNDTRVWSEAFPLVAGASVADLRLAERLDRQGYRRVKGRPETPGEYFWGFETFWIFRRAHASEDGWRPETLIGLALRKEDGVIVGARGKGGDVLPLGKREHLRLEPELLAESLDGTRGPRAFVPLAEIPEHLWRALVAAEDSRFFKHGGVDARAVARAAAKNVEAGKVSQGGSTLTQQLVKNRDLSSKRTLGRKVSEAARAIALEAEHSKETILEAYLNQVYFGQVDGRALHGVEAGAQAYFSVSVRELDLARSAQLIGMV